MFELHADDLAVDDTLYELERALRGEAIPLDKFLKHVRHLARRQFEARAVATKVLAAQVQASAAGK
jgi:ESCRT-I complex subunit TSG101